MRTNGENILVLACFSRIKINPDTMNCIELLKGIKIAIKAILVIAVISVTSLQFKKCLRENTKISISYDDERDLELPSISFCPEYLEDNKTMQESMTFEDWYMKNVLNASDFFDFADQTFSIAGYVQLFICV